MDDKGLIEIVCRRLGKVYAIEKPSIDAALLGALDEFGLYVDVPKAQGTRNETLVAGENKVIGPSNFQRFVSVMYQVTGETRKKFLDYRRPEFIDQINSTDINIERDNFSFYTLSGQWLTIAPGTAQTGGIVIIRTQNRLTVGDIPYLADTMLLADSMVCNLISVESPSYMALRQSVVRRLTKSVEKQDVPVTQKRELLQDPNYQAAENARLNIYRGGGC